MNQQDTSAAPATEEHLATKSTKTLSNENPDPDEDDLDDLDELLDDFSSSKQVENQQRAPSVPPLHHTSADDHASSNVAVDDFNLQLQEQMAALMGNGDESPEMQKGIQAMLQELGAAVDSASVNGDPKLGGSQGAPSTATDENFQDAILRTMERMQVSGEKATAAAATDQDSDDVLARMLKELQSDNQSGAAGGDEDFSKMLMTMMEQLTNKDILYDPMKELHDKFPSWMSRNQSSVGTDDLRRYEKQQQLIAEIVRKFEERTYSDSNAKDREYIVERMQEMQAAGSPPTDLVGDMSGAQEALQDMNSGCAQQ